MEFSTPESSDECYRGTKYPSADRVVHYFTASPAEWEEERQTMDLLGSKCVKKEDADAEVEAGKERDKQMEHMFDKAVTPSDVGKLNRLVIPKQHAEKYFPLDPNANENGGLVLSFEENNGKIWTFRYSYWNSSQSYVLTKGWSRFVRDKQLHAGDIVSFQRQSLSSSSFPHVRFFIGWRRRPKLESKKQHNEISGPPMNPPFLTSNPFSFTFTNVGTVDIPIASHESQTSAPRWLTHGNTFATIPRLPQGSILTIVPANAYDAQTPQENSTTKRSHETQHSSTKKSKGFRLFGVDLQDSSEIDCNY